MGRGKTEDMNNVKREDSFTKSHRERAEHASEAAKNKPAPAKKDTLPSIYDKLKDAVKELT